MKTRKFHILFEDKALCGENRRDAIGHRANTVFMIEDEHGPVFPRRWCITCKRLFNANVAGARKLK